MCSYKDELVRVDKLRGWNQSVIQSVVPSYESQGRRSYRVGRRKDRKCVERTNIVIDRKTRPWLGSNTFVRVIVVD